ncbi:group II intron maturase-specific domain-containing protein [Enterocloster clostridioformis]|uniref:group II intron maturase-specific domain-containing protein n=1 Tax=Enterocloster clostridioformis TaxID=1531 RepID=UPI002674AC40|nr:group II intron maturase-specific domain-containing protein [Enterocloster clostridioformis]
MRLETFDYLGFTFYCGRTRKGYPLMMPKINSKRFRQKLKNMKIWLYANRDQPLRKLMGMLNLKFVGHYRYYGISFNSRMIANYKQQVREMLFKVINRRSDRKSYTREGFIEMLKYYLLAVPKIYVSLL